MDSSKRQALALAALGVVFGDIGTSPLYAFRESFHHGHGLAMHADNVIGVASLVFWSLILVVTVKYLGLILRADNRGEGGILALMSLAVAGGGVWRRRILTTLALAGTALMFGDGMITPAISVLSAVEGIAVIRPGLEPAVVPVTLAILVGLFAVQYRGTAGVGKLFGPVMLVWFSVLGLLGLTAVVREPAILRALDPSRAVVFFADNGWSGFITLGTVFLVVTGGEALYADLGHFGRDPIRRAWFTVALPALVLNYLGQGALLLGSPEVVDNVFFALAPGWALVPLVALSTAATVIASQALITGTYSLATHAVQGRYLPPILVRHTSPSRKGEIYVPAVNWALLAACSSLVIGFGSSSALAAAYGLAVTGAMTVTTLLFLAVVRYRWGWSWGLACLVCLPLIAVDLGFLSANVLKIPAGGWFPLVIGTLTYLVFTTWRRGREVVAERVADRVLPFDVLMAELDEAPPARVPGVAVFLYSRRTGVPPALFHSFKHYKVLHRQTVFLTVEVEDVPVVAETERVEIEALGHGFYRMVLRFGFREQINLPEAVQDLAWGDLSFPPMETTWFLGRQSLVRAKRPLMSRWRRRLFTLMMRNTIPRTTHFHLPPNRVVELGTQVEI